MSKVYVCTGSCHGQSDQPVNCGAESCEKHDQPLTEMNKCDSCGTVYGMNETHTCS